MTLIKSAQIIDGLGKPPFRADVLLKRNRISAIGNLTNKKADLVIDGLGMYLTPGFIDIQASSDHYLSIFTNPSLEDFLLQGVTTIFGGHCGSSLSPLLYGTLESIRKWADPNRINVDWHSTADFLSVLDRRKIGVNFGTLVGHSTVRRALVGEEIRDLTQSEMAVFKNLIAESLDQGAFGFSTGLDYAHSRKTPRREIEELVKIITKKGALYATHLRNEREGINNSVHETIEVTKKTNANTLVSHFRPIIGFEKEYKEALNALEGNSSTMNIHFNNYPYDTSIVPIYTILPVWAQVERLEKMLENLEVRDTQKKLEKYFADFNGDDLYISQVAKDAGFDYLIGKSIGELAKNQEIGVPAAIIALMRLTKLRAVVFFRNISHDLTVRSLMQPMALITANSSGLADSKHVRKHERFTNTFPKFLEIVRSRKMMPLEAAIAKITALPAEKIGLKSRGKLVEGNYADLVLLSREQDNRFEVNDVFVNGERVVRGGEFQGKLTGRILRKER